MGKWRRALVQQSAEIAAKADASAVAAAVTSHETTFPHGGAATWDSITGKPATFPPTAHGDHLTEAAAAAAAPVQSVAGRTGAVVLAKADVGLSNVDNTSDAGKPVSTATQAALDLKAGVSALTAHEATHAPANAQKNSDITLAEIEAKLTGQISSHTHAGGSGSAWTTVKKATDEPRTASATLTADSALVVTLAAATRYRIYIDVMLTTANATMDYKFDCNYTGTIGTIRCKRRYSAAGAVAGTDSENTLASLSIVPSTPVAATTTGVGYVEIDINILTVLGGTFQFRWAQNTSDAGALTVLAGSYLEYMTVP